MTLRKQLDLDRYKHFLPALLGATSLFWGGCVQRSSEVSRSTSPTAPAIASPSPLSSAEAEAMPVTLPVLDALFADQPFVAELKSKLQLNDEQISRLKEIASNEVSRLRQQNAEQKTGSTTEARARASELIHEVIGEAKAQDLAALVRDHWNKGSEELEVAKEKPIEVTMLPGPNAVPGDTRIVVNAPAFRMDVFENGSLVKSYRIGIGYPEFPLPGGLRKAQTIIFNPTWTPPDSPWVASMKDVMPGEKVEAGSKLNPLGPIKIPIGMPSLIHGGKPPSKIGTFASHGCVGLTNAQIRDFAKVLAKAGGSELSDKVIAAYAKKPDKTGVVRLSRPVPVELRYETIVVEDGRLHIYRDVYDHNTNTEENLRAVLQANGVRWDDLTPADQLQLTDALNSMSRHPNKKAKASPGNTPLSPTLSPASNRNKAGEQTKKTANKNQKEVILELSALSGKGYPAPVALSTGSVTVSRNK